MRPRLAIIALAFAALPASAVDSTAWPPPPEVLGRMRELQATIANPAASKEERAAARAELQHLMKSPAGAESKDDGKKPARAAIDPFPSVAKPMEGKLVTEPPPTARLEVVPDVPPRKPAINPATGSIVQPTSPGVAVDPRTGRLLHETPNGYIDPRTGQFVPK